MSSFASSVSPTSQVERRSHARRRINGLTYADFGADNGAIILDLGEGGLGFQSVTPVSVGQAVLLKFKLPEVSEHVESYAEVAWLNDSGKGGGLRFVELNGDAKTHIRVWADGDFTAEAERENSQADHADRNVSASAQMSSSEDAGPNPIQNTASSTPAPRLEAPAHLREDSGAIHGVEAAGEPAAADLAAPPSPQVTSRPEAPEPEHSVSPDAPRVASPQVVQQPSSAAQIAAARPVTPSVPEFTVAPMPRAAATASRPVAKASTAVGPGNRIDPSRRAHPRSQEPAEFSVPGIPYESTELPRAARIPHVDASASKNTNPAPAVSRRAATTSVHTPAEWSEQSTTLKAGSRLSVRRPNVGQASMSLPASTEWEDVAAKQQRDFKEPDVLRSQIVKVGIGAAAGALFMLAIIAGLPSLRSGVQAKANKGLGGSNLAAGQPAFQVEVADINTRRWMLTSGGAAGSPFSDASSSRREAASAGAPASRKETTDSASSTPGNLPDAPKASLRKAPGLALSRPRVTGIQQAAQLTSPSIFDGITPPMGSLGTAIAPSGSDLPRPDSQPEGRTLPQPRQAAVLVQRVAPLYPLVARQQHVTGEVHIGATIGKDGIPRNLKPINGDSRLIDAALAAISQWRYQPASVGGDPVDTQTVISVVFELK
jgi:TonB family protein